MKIEILTRCTRPSLLTQVRESIVKSYDNIFSFSDCPEIDLTWRIIFDTSGNDKLDAKLLSTLNSDDTLRIYCHFWEGIPGDFGHTLLNRAIELAHKNSWIYILDDDNEMHEDFLSKISSIVQRVKSEGIIFSQKVGGVDFSKVDVREAKPENVKISQIDMGQFILKRTLFDTVKFETMNYVADGVLIEKLYSMYPDKFYFENSILCYYNSLQKTSKSYMLPRVLLLGSKNTDLKSKKIADFESNDLNIVTADDEDTVDKIISHDPDSIITIGESFSDFPTLCTQQPDIRLRWSHLDNEDNAGDVAYSCAMNYILTSHDQDMVSVFTPIFNTKSKLYRTYESVKQQTYVNWEWVLVNDSTDVETLRIAEEIASKDPRVKVFDFKEKTKGLIGESKYRACCMTKGKFLVELDHDDVILPHALQAIVDAFDKYPDAGFAYTDCAEIREDYESMMYGDGFAFGYGSYRVENYYGKDFQIADTPNINPLTIRHIVGVPNHTRVWRRETYFAIGGHNRRLSITDDYELIVRTFLVTKMIKISKGCYLQFHHENNSQNATRSDIQRRVRTIAAFYNEKIKNRFTELGVNDWAYNPRGDWNVVPLRGEDEKFVNYVI